MKGPQDSLPFHPYYTIKDMFGLGVFLLLLSYLVFYAPTCSARSTTTFPPIPW